MSDPREGVFVYHPLNTQTPLYAAFADAVKRPAPSAVSVLSDDDRTRLLNRYRQHMRDVVERRGLKADTALEEAFKEDERALVKRFHAFFPALVQHTSLTDKAARVAVFFPVLDCFDNRCVEIKGHNEAIFITSRTLDAIELFANTLSLCVQLNGLELRTMLGLEDPPPAHILLAWMTLRARDIPDVYRLDPVVGADSRNLSARSLRDELYKNHEPNWLPAAGRRAFAHHRLSLCLSWLMLRALNRLVRSAHFGGERYLGLRYAVPAARSVLSLDSEYLATLVLSFIVLHEIGHFALGHNTVDGGAVDPVLQQIAEASARFSAENGGQGHNLIGSLTGHETAADAFALEVIEEAYRDPMLEAATLWCAALAGSNDDCGDWIENFAANPRGKYPGFAMRVWFLNGKFSSGRRQGRIAQEITRQAEALAAALGQDDDAAGESAEVFRKLWQIASEETGTARRGLSKILSGLRLPWR
jgi:hypothetical protein